MLFADLSGFTALSERLDPEDVKALARACTDRLSLEVQRFGGTILTVAGDQVVAAFGAPVAHEDDAERAVRAALAMRDCPLRDHLDRPLQVHVGVNTGEVMAGLIGPRGQEEFAVMGDTTNVAARIMSAAPPGSVLVGEETWRATRTSVRFRDLPPISVKGKQQPIAVWEAMEALHAPKSRPLGTAPLVGRDEELGVLSGIWLRVVREARPHLVSVIGEPGIGKSRLVSEFEKRFCQEARVVHGRCLPYGEAFGYWALTGALKEAAGISSDSDAASARAQLQALVHRLFHHTDIDFRELTRHLALLTGLESSAGSSGHPEDQRNLHSSVRMFFEALARERPLCWMIEDIHWADDALLDLIVFVADRTKEAALLILTQARPGLLENRPNWGAGLRAYNSIPLDVLNPQDARELILSLCRERGLPETLVGQVGHGAGGNPLFAEELVAMISERGPQTGVPSAIKTLIAARLDALPPAERRCLQLASVFGKSFWIGGLHALDPDHHPLEHVEGLEQKDLVRDQPRSQFRLEREFVFKHDLIRDVAYEMLPRAERRPMHGRIVDWIERVAGDQVDNYLDQLAHHAAKAGLQTRALDYLVRAAERARDLAAHRQEAALLAHAIEIAEQLGTPAFAAELRGRRGTAFWQAGLWEESRRELEIAAAQLPPDALERRAEILVYLASGCFYAFEVGLMRIHAEQAVRLANEAARPDLAAEAMGWLGFAAQSDGDLTSAVRYHQQARTLATGRPVLSRTCAALTFYLVGQLGDAVTVGREAVEVARQRNHSWALMTGLPHLALALASHGSYREALDTFEEARRLGQERGIWPLLARSLSLSAGFHLDLYDFAGHEALAEEAREAGLSGDFSPTVVSSGIDLVLNYTRRQEVGRAESLLRDVAKTAAEVGGWHSWLWNLRLDQARAELAFARSEWAACIQLASAVLAVSQAKGRLRYQVLALWTRARAHHALGDRAQALRDLHTALAVARDLADPAIFLRVAASLLAIEGTPLLAAEAAACARRIEAALPDDDLRRRFTSAEPVRLSLALA